MIMIPPVPGALQNCRCMTQTVTGYFDSSFKKEIMADSICSSPGSSNG